ncbi:hypothetical protein M3202_21470 [Alkalihalobacillus oceani]|uniref:Uncharacterized protein n=1 Tax=Halalkalibacter oceani TaxID=1653776 RepID=A0A9X2IQR0_9BACI|nr:hypothetical protein [Halalkalibacter oceani]MCM3716615.1 hypothetical protein [Halalkalibacter oceani]
MKAVPFYGVNIDDPFLGHIPQYWRFQKHHVKGKLFEHEDGSFSYELFHESFKGNVQKNNFFDFDEALMNAETWIDTWYHVQGRLLALK